MKFSKHMLLGALLAATSLGGLRSGNAAEPGPLLYAPGAAVNFGTDLPPIPGLFGVSQTVYNFSNGLYGPDGKKLPIPGFKNAVGVEVLRALVVTPWEVLGARVAAMAIVPIGTASQTITVPFPGAIHSSSTGFGNISFVPVMLEWKLPNHQKFGVNLEIGTPWSTYSKRAALLGNANIGSNYTAIMPHIGYRYDRPDGPVASIMLRGIFNTRNTFTNYRTGTVMQGEGLLGWNFGKWTVGVVGSYTKQIEKDSGLGPISGGLTAFKAGPSISYNFGAGVVALNYQHAIYQKNGPNVSNLWFNVAFPLYVPPPPAGARPGVTKP